MKEIIKKNFRDLRQIFILSFLSLIAFAVVPSLTYAENITTSKIELSDQSIVYSPGFESANIGQELESSALNNEQPADATINSTNSNIIKRILDFIGRVLFELIGPAFGTFLGVFLATSDNRKKAEEKEKANNEKVKEIKRMLDEELNSIQNAVKTLDDTKSYDYMTPVWNVVKGSNIIDIFDHDEFTSYIDKYVAIARALDLEQSLAEKKSTNQVDQELSTLKESVSVMRQYIANGFVVIDSPNEDK